MEDSAPLYNPPYGGCQAAVASVPVSLCPICRLLSLAVGRGRLCRWRRAWRSFAPGGGRCLLEAVFGFLEPLAGAVRFDNVHAVGQAVQQGSR